MKNLKTFEAFAGKPLPVAPAHLFAYYYMCEKCESSYITHLKNSKCTGCGEGIKDISEKEFLSKVKDQVSPEEYQQILTNREEFMDEIIHLSDLPKDYEN